MTPVQAPAAQGERWTAYEYVSPAGNWYVRDHGGASVVSGPGLTEKRARLIAAAPTMYDFVARCAAHGNAEAIAIMESVRAGR